eukprot:gene3516-6163_t
MTKEGEEIKIDLKDIPLIKTLKDVPYEQIKQIGTLYVCSSGHWYKTKMNLIHALLKDLNLKEKDIKDILSLLEINGEEELPPLEAFFFSEKIHDDYKWLSLWSFLALTLLHEKKYDSRVRVSLNEMASILKIDLEEFYKAEDDLAIQLGEKLEEIKKVSEQQKKKSALNTIGRMALVGGASLIGGTALLVTGLLAAPLVIPAIVGVLGTIGVVGAGVASITAMGSSIIILGGVPLVAGVFGATGAGLVGYQVLKRTAGISYAEFQRIEFLNEKVDFKDSKFKSEKLKKYEFDIKEEEDMKIFTQKPDKEILKNEDEIIQEINEKKQPIEQEKQPLKQEKQIIEKKQEIKIEKQKIEEKKEERVLSEINKEKEIPKINLNAIQNPGMNVYIAVSGFLKYDKKTETPYYWQVMRQQHDHGEMFTFDWEPDLLLEVGSLITDFVGSNIAKYIQTYWLQTVGAMIVPTLGLLMASMTWPLLSLKVFSLINNPWSLSLDRADKAGIVLADVLASHIHGNRPVNLVGFSMGARVIFKCLMELEKKNLHGIVENVFLFGAPVQCLKDNWKKARSVVGGRFVNGYSIKDWVLAYLYRASSLNYDVGGLQPSYPQYDIENVDISDIIEGHHQYSDPLKMNKILKRLDIHRSCKIIE